MLFTDVQRSVRLNKKKKSTNTSPYPDEVIDRLARAFYPAILACWNSKEGQREFAAWQAEQAHHATSKEKQSVPDGERPVVHIAMVCGLFLFVQTHAPLDICEQHTMCLMLCCLLLVICECSFQRSKVVLVLLNDLQNHITLCIIGHLLQLVVE